MTIRAVGGKTVSGGTLTLYRVAGAVYENGDNRFAFTSEFQDCGLSLTVLEEEDSGAPALSAALAAYVSEKKLKGSTVTIDDAGRAAFSDLTLGLYLLVQETPAPGYEAISPFVVTVPLWNGKKLVYDVDASPKPSLAVMQTPPPPTPTPSPTPSGSRLPQTGQLWWPVPVLALTGLLLLALGLRGKKKNES